MGYFREIIFNLGLLFEEVIVSYTRKEPTQARKYFMIVNLPLFCI